MQPNRGFTTLELLIISLIVSILLAIAVPAFVGLIARMRLQAASDEIYRVFQQAKREATRRKVGYAADFMKTADGMAYCLHPTEVSCRRWQFVAGVEFARCTLPAPDGLFEETDIEETICRVRFHYRGTVYGRLGGVYINYPDLLR
jgi:Tfp pilus assembly protein PilE